MNQERKGAVLIVDDHPVNRMILKKMLMPYPVQTEEAADGETAVQMIKEKEYDIVLLDCIMPGWDGVRTAQEIRALPGRTEKPVIVAVSGEYRTEQSTQLLQAGVNIFLEKPIRMEQLLQYLPEGCSVQSEDASMNDAVRKSLVLQNALYQTMEEQLKRVEQTFAADERRSPLSERQEAAIHSCHTLKGLMATMEAEELSRSFAQLLEWLREGEWERYTANVPKIYRAALDRLAEWKQTAIVQKVSKADENSCPMETEAVRYPILYKRKEELLEAFRIYDYERILFLFEELCQNTGGAVQQGMQVARGLAEQFQYAKSRESFLKWIDK